MGIDELQQRAYDHSFKSGFWDDYHALISALDNTSKPELYDCAKGAVISQKLALIHSEVTEALEEVRTGKYWHTHEVGEKPEGFPSELADIVIRVADLAHALGIDLQDIVTEKIEYNTAKRGYKHGKRF